MTPFGYVRAHGARQALEQLQSQPFAKYLGGGTNLVDLMREGIESPQSLIDVARCSSGITSSADGGLRVGAGVTNTALAMDAGVRTNFPLLSRAILSGASAQIRNMATVAGNLMQRTRCCYFYDDASRCNKRTPGVGCDAIGGFTRYHAILGASPSCVAVHPSDMCVALAALDTTVHIAGPEGTRTLPFLDLHRFPGDAPHIETTLQHAELITALEVSPLKERSRSTYRKVRDRASYAFALVSVAAVARLDDTGNVDQIRIALGGVAHKPWRAHKAEAALLGKPPSESQFRAAADEELAEAKPLRDNAFKIELAKRAIVSTLRELYPEERS
jgi:xanthine dehydrogenase YagS FAD-binding subunit